jgi:hypothetical protein
MKHHDYDRHLAKQGRETTNVKMRRRRERERERERRR